MLMCMVNALGTIKHSGSLATTGLSLNDLNFLIAYLSALEVPVHLYRGHRVSLTGRLTKLLAT